jgi:SEC-C motif/Uncharacterised protein family (UPF0149)
MIDDFPELVERLSASGLAVDPPHLHGLLTGFATTPDPDMNKLWKEMGGDQPLAVTMKEAVADLLDFLSEDLSVNEFRAEFREDRDEPKRWLRGYFRAVELHEEQWQEENESHPKAAMALLLLHSLLNQELRKDLHIEQPGQEELREDPQIVSELVAAIYQRTHGDLDDEFDFSQDQPLIIPGFSRDTLVPLDDEALFSIVTDYDDRLPLQVVTECASRGDAMVTILRRHLEHEANWDVDADSGDWWALLHAVFILGLIPGDVSAQALLEGFRRITFDAHGNNLADWLSGYWPALCRNKSDYTTEPLRRIAEERALDWYPRSHAVECVLAEASEQGPTQLDAALDWVATLCADESNSPDFRVLAAQYLLSFPRERYLPLMKELIALQKQDSWYSKSFDHSDIESSFARGDDPDWVRFDNPWKFYELNEIERRQRRWIREDRGREEREYIDERVYEPVETCVREQPKVGRNDPCPCGSGRKYKKCCLQ